jgi:putative endonuclease
MSSVSRTLYTGVTNDLERRTMEHKQARPVSFTARCKVNQLVYFEHFSDIDQAIDRETELKKMARRTKVRLIESMNPDWLDLSHLSEAAAKGSGIPRCATKALLSSG